MEIYKDLNTQANKDFENLLNSQLFVSQPILVSWSSCHFTCSLESPLFDISLTNSIAKLSDFV